MGKGIFRSEAGCLLGAPLGCGIGGTIVTDFYLVFTLIPLVPALAFMLWVLWGLEKQIRRDRCHHDRILRSKG